MAVEEYVDKSKKWMMRNPKKSIALGTISFTTLGLYLLLKTKSSDIPRDMHLLWVMLKHSRKVESRMQEEWGLADFWLESCSRAGWDNECLRFIEDHETVTYRKGLPTSYTWRQVNDEANKMANWMLKEGFQKRDVVVLLMNNRPEFIFSFLALAKIGCICALINTNLTGKPLRHCLVVSKAQRFLLGVEHQSKITDGLRQELKGNWYVVAPTTQTPLSGFQYISKAIAESPATKIPKIQRSGILGKDVSWYIYTSGTTGTPKAAKITHTKMWATGHIFQDLMGLTKSDIIYTTLPLYHSSGGVIGIGISWATGIPLVFRRKFSAKNFWKDCKENKVTATQYIGEICRYLYSQPPSEYDSTHRVRVMTGNGMRPDVWAKFQGRFGVDVIAELYGSTEGNIGMLNPYGKVGAVGYVSPLFSALYPVKIVKFDVQSEKPLRDKKGFCIECGNMEVGEIIGKIEEDNEARKFHGYTSEEATRKKILTDVFEKGDKWFRSGDLMKRDGEGFYYFIDRIGDTFRWKGENVATTEVAEVLSDVPGVLEANVYGVSVPHHDGRAGMARLVVDDKFDLQQLYHVISKNLASYSQPLFLRLGKEMTITGTFKHKKTDLVKEGFDPNLISDPLYFRDSTKKTFVPLDKALFLLIQSGAANGPKL
eukprot:TRINITY_DN6227_c0_g1_i1.p1 TRINITY_DN6227_c0_g1~~TRINITY_DN6227_c0_g1_i1.p1  ORF type:complete len:654 (+),score=99.33 TRINITY_DN6227_c0_g1_i1:18-1979(+)